MRMRKRPLRGEKYHLSSGQEVTFVEVLGNGLGDKVSVIGVSGRLESVDIKDLDLPVIDTKYYERLEAQKSNL